MENEKAIEHGEGGGEGEGESVRVREPCARRLLGEETVHVEKLAEWTTVLTRVRVVPVSDVLCDMYSSLYVDVLFPLLTLSGGQQRLGRQKSAAILSTLYGSHVFSAWVSPC